MVMTCDQNDDQKTKWRKSLFSRELINRVNCKKEHKWRIPETDLDWKQELAVDQMIRNRLKWHIYFNKISVTTEGRIRNTKQEENSNRWTKEKAFVLKLVHQDKALLDTEQDSFSRWKWRRKKGGEQTRGGKQQNNSYHFYIVFRCVSETHHHLQYGWNRLVCSQSTWFRPVFLCLQKTLTNQAEEFDEVWKIIGSKGVTVILHQSVNQISRE